MTNEIEIFAFSGSRRDELTGALSQVLSGWEKTGDLSYYAAEARQSRGRFNPDDDCRLVLVVPSLEDFRRCLETAVTYMDSPGRISPEGPADILYGEGKPSGKVAFLFPGQGSQYVPMGKDLTDFFQDAKIAVEDMERFFDNEKPLRSFIFPPNPTDKNEKNQLESALRQTEIAQPAIGAVSLAMIKTLALFNVYPDAAAGHSYGELSALCAGGRLGETDFFRLSVWRGRLMADACGPDKGQMLAVKAHPDKILEIMKESGLDLVLANKNSPEQGVLSGATPDIAQMQKICKDHRLRAMVLPVSAAFHSRLVSNAAEGFRGKIDAVDILPAAIPVYSNQTALPYPSDPAETRRLLGEHLVSPVNFLDQVKNMHAAGVRTFIEAGPKNVLTGLVKTILKGDSFQAFSVDASSGKQHGLHDLARVLARLAADGYPVDLTPWGQG